MIPVTECHSRPIFGPREGRKDALRMHRGAKVRPHRAGVGPVRPLEGPPTALTVLRRRFPTPGGAARRCPPGTPRPDRWHSAVQGLSRRSPEDPHVRRAEVGCAELGQDVRRPRFRLALRAVVACRSGPTDGFAHGDGTERTPCLGGAYGNVPVPVPGLGTGGDRGDPRYEAHRRPLVQRDGMSVAVPSVPGTTGVDDRPVTERPMRHPVVRHAPGHPTHSRPGDVHAIPVTGRHHSTDVHGPTRTTEEPRAVGHSVLMRPGSGRRQGLLRQRGGGRGRGGSGKRGKGGEGGRVRRSRDRRVRRRGCGRQRGHARKHGRLRDLRKHRKCRQLGKCRKCR